MARLNLDRKAITLLIIYLIGDREFIRSHLCKKLMAETSHKAIVVEVSSEKISHLLEKSCSWFGWIKFRKINIKNDSCLETLIRTSDLTINLTAIFTSADYNT